MTSTTTTGATPPPAPLAAPAPGIGYLPGLDGLRALSVLAVVAYHLELDWATGGYLGVEVFFVVSGYLITLLMLDEHHRTGTVRRLRFWGRRARRLLPAVIVLVGAVLAWTALALDGGELRRFRDEAVASLLYVQNWHGVLTEEPYFVAFGRPSPLRHLWSLAIEEQFYLLWPLLLPAALRRVGRRRASALILAGAGASVALMAATADIAAPERAYYGTDTRAFGILLGCALAFAWRPDRFRADIATAPRRMLGWAGIVALAALAWQLANRSEFDPWTFPWGFVSVDACTLVLIVAVTHPGSSLRNRVGSPALSAIGRRSYSLYLWHWPVIVFTRPGVDWGFEGTSALVGRLVLIGALSELSYRFVEQPFRDGRAQAWLWRAADRANGRRLLGPSLAVASLPVVLLVASVVNAPAPDVSVAANRTPVTLDLTPPPSSRATTSTTTTTAPAKPTPTSTPAPTVTPPPPAEPRPVPDVTVVGESVTLGGAPALQAIYGPRVQIDAVEGRSFADGIALLEQLAQAGRLTPVVFVHFGNNGAVPEGGLERIGAAIGPDRTLILATVRVDRPWEGQVNDAVRGYVAGCDHCLLADWHAIAATDAALTVDDGIHLSDAGELRYAALVMSLTG